MLTAEQYRIRMTEAEMEQTIRDAVGSRGLVFHIRDSRRTPEMEHFPDLVVILPERRAVAFVELKSQQRRVTDGQRAVMATLSECNRAEAWIVRPDPRDGEISYDSLIEWLEESR